VLNWNPVAGAAYYNVYRSQLVGGGPGATYVALGSSGAPSFVDATAAPGQTFFYVVTASSGGTESASSNEAAVQIP
jgi:fibronectin type 3 domain-containing protein